MLRLLLTLNLLPIIFAAQNLCLNAPPVSASHSMAVKPLEVVSGDFNLDGKMDFACVSPLAGNTKLMVMYATGPATYSAPVSYSVSFDPRALVSNDFNGDGRADIAVANMNGTLNIYMAHASGSLTSYSQPNCNSNPVSITSADFNSDGKADLAVANNSMGYVTVLIGNGLGGFGSATTYTTGPSPVCIRAADVNNDGKKDLVVANNTGNSISMLGCNGSGSFTSTTTFILPGPPKALHCADVNADGYMDVAVTVTNTPAVILFKGSNTGTFAVTNYSFVHQPHAITSADLNNDGYEDLAVALRYQNIISLMYGSSTATFSPPLHIITEPAPTSLLSGDYNGDAQQDIACLTYSLGNLTLYHGSGTGTFVAARSYTAGYSAARDATLNDFDLDGKNDIALMHYYDNRISILKGAGNGSFTPLSSYTTPANPERILSDDVNNDGDPDIVFSFDSGTNRIGVLLGNGSGAFTGPSYYGYPGYSDAMALGDFNNDGNKDIAITNYGIQSTHIMLGNGTGSFALPVGNFTHHGSPAGITVADLNNDANQDLVIAAGNGASVLMGVGNGSFLPTANYTVGTKPSGVVTHDFNGDSYVDVAYCNYYSSDVAVLLGSPSGTLGSMVTYSTLLGPQSIKKADFNGDGYMDLSVVASFEDGITFLLGSASGTFAPAIAYAAVVNGQHHVTGDVDNDGKPDIITPQLSPLEYAVYLNSGPKPTIVAPPLVCAGKPITLYGGGALTYSWSTSANTPTITPVLNAATPFTLTGFYSNGCSGQTTMNIAVQPSPTVTVNSGSICAGTVFTMQPAGATSYSYSSGSATVAPLLNSTYTVIGYLSSGCNNEALATVSVTPLPTITVNSGTVCAGSAFVFQTSGAATYTFSSGSATVYPASTTAYSVTGTSQNGCQTSAPAIATISVSPLPVISMPSTSLCVGKSVTLTPSGALSYTYMNGGPVITPVSTGTYSIAGTSAEGCVDTVSTLVTVHPLPVVTVSNGVLCAGSVFTISPSGAATYSYPGGSQTVSPTSNTQYTLTGISTAGCVSTATFGIIVMQPPAISVNSGSVCAGEKFVMMPTGGSVYNYSSGSPTVYPQSNSIYTITAVAANGCTAEAVSTVTVGPLPQLSVNNPDTVICTGNTATLLVTGALSYSWSTNSNDSALIITPVSTTNYTISGTGANGCINSAIYTQSVSACLGVNHRSGSLPFTITPNPGNGIYLLQNVSGAHVRILNVEGRLVYEGVSDSPVKKIDLSKEANGVYYLQLTLDGKVISAVMVKQ